tara:strand:+ start:5104 stop:5451 length:348 start_codon:yes stop_codon:yes gene_type:complete
MIEANVPGEATQTSVETPQTITISMILEDLDNGVDRNAIKEKYNLQAWEVKQMFEHPALKGKKAKKVRKLSFNFVDDTALDAPIADPAQTSIPMDNGYLAEPHGDTSDDWKNSFE